MPRTTETRMDTPEGRVEACREGMTALVDQLDGLLDKLEKQYEEVESRDRRDG